MSPTSPPGDEGGGSLPASCPIPLRGDRIQIGHGGGGRMTRELVDRIFVPAYGAEGIQHDAASLELDGSRIALSTDAYVVSPLFFPGGDIGKLAVLGTVNDLAMAGARAAYLTASFVLEEGLPLRTLERVARSMGETARGARVRIVAGDTKVVERGRADGLYLTTAGVGSIVSALHPRRIATGDAILVNRDLARHGFAVMAERHGLSFDPPLASDCDNLWPAISRLIESSVELHCARDLTRGGLATALCELAADARADFRLRERDIPLVEGVRGAAELLGLDALHIASEGAFVAFVPERQAQQAVEVLRAHGAGDACIIGSVNEKRSRAARVVLESSIGGSRLLESLSGEQLPRIC